MARFTRSAATGLIENPRNVPLQTSAYNPADWYWIVGGSTEWVFSSAQNKYVPPDDPAYVAWLADGNMPTPIANEDELWDVLGLVKISYRTFRERWTEQEREDAHRETINANNWKLADFTNVAMAQDRVDLSSPYAAEAKALFVSSGVLTQARADVIFKIR